MASCTGTNRVTGYDDPVAKKNFVDDGCVEQKQVKNGKPSQPIKLAPRSFCVCVFEDIWKVHKLPWDELMDYEKKIADAQPGDAPPMPVKLQEAIKNCTAAVSAGPRPATTTTAAK